MNNSQILTIREPLEMQSVSNELKKNGKSIAFVPTMGALHKGHLSLIDEASNRADICVVSIFVNPTQFGPNEDYSKYTRDYEGDLEKLSDYNVDYLFYPYVETVYNEGFQTNVEVKELQKVLCGKHRQGHFNGVTTVVLKFFNIVKPEVAIFGKKDYQQYKIIERMVSDLNLDIEVVGMPIVREKDGLAMSSRNEYLSSTDRKRASVIYKSLIEVKDQFKNGNRTTDFLIQNSKNMLNMNQISDIDYFGIMDPESFEFKAEAVKGDLVAVAVRIGSTRLIDNINI